MHQSAFSRILCGFLAMLTHWAAADFLALDKTTAAPLETVVLTVSDVNETGTFTIVTPSGHIYNFGGTLNAGVCTASYVPSYMTGLYQVSAQRDGVPTETKTFTVGIADWGRQIHLVQWQASPVQYFYTEPILLNARLQDNSAAPLNGFSKSAADALPNRTAGGMYIQRKIIRFDADGNIIARLYVYFDTTGAPNILGNNYAHIYAGTQVLISLYGGDGVSPLPAGIGITTGFFNNDDNLLTSVLSANQWTVGVIGTLFQQDKIAYLDISIPPTLSLSDAVFSVDAIQYNYNSGIGDYIHIGETALASGSFPAGGTFTSGTVFSSLGRFPIRLPLNPRPAGLVYYYLNYTDFPGHSLNDGSISGTDGLYSNSWIWKRPVATTAQASFFADKWGYRGARGQAITLTPEPPVRNNLLIGNYQIDLPFYTEGETRVLSAVLKDEAQNPVTGFQTREPVVDSTAGKLSIVSQNVRTDELGNSVVRLLLYFDTTGQWSNIYAGTQVEIALFGPDGISGMDPNISVQPGSLNAEGFIVSSLQENQGIYNWISSVDTGFSGADRQVFLDVVLPPGSSPSEVVYAVNRIIYRPNQDWADQIAIKNTTVNMSSFPQGGTWGTFEFKQGDLFGNLGYFPLYLSLNPADRGLMIRMDGGVQTEVLNTLQATNAGLYSYSHTWTGQAGPDYRMQMCFSRWGYFGHKALCSEILDLYFSGQPRYLGGLTDAPVMLGSTWQKDLNSHFYVDRNFELVCYESSDARVLINGSIASFSPADLNDTITGLVLTARSTVDPNISASSDPFTLYAANCLTTTDCPDLSKPCKCIQYQCRYYEPVKNYSMNPQGCDLSIFNQDAGMSTLFPQPGQEVEIWADVYNKGTTYAFNTAVTFYLDEVDGLIIDVNMLPVVPITYMNLPFRSERAWVKWTVPLDLTGPHRIWIKVEGTCPGIDGEDMLSNNYAAVDFFIADPQLNQMDTALAGGCPAGAVPPSGQADMEVSGLSKESPAPEGQNCETFLMRIPISVQVCENEVLCAPVTGYEHSYWGTWYWPSWSGYCQEFNASSDMIWALIVTYEVSYGIFSGGPAAVNPSLLDAYDYLSVPFGWGTGHLPCHPEPTLFPYLDYGGVSNPGCAGLCPVSAWDCGQGIRFQPKFDSPYYNAYAFTITSGGARTVTRCREKADSIEVPYQICYPYDSPEFNLPFNPFGGGPDEDGGYGPNGLSGSSPGGGPPLRFELGQPLDNDGNTLRFDCYFCSSGGKITSRRQDAIHCYAVPPYNQILLRKGWNLWAAVLDPLTAGADRQIALKAGWNLLGYSSTDAFDWAQATVSDGAETKSLAQAHKDGWLQETIYYRDAGMQVTRFVPGDDYALRTNKGYWLFAARDNLVLTLPGAGGASFDSALPQQAIAVSYSGQVLSLTDAQSAGWLDSRIFEYDTAAGAYTIINNPDDVLKPWKGYLIRSNFDGVRLITGQAAQPAAAAAAVGQTESASAEQSKKSAALKSSSKPLRPCAGKAAPVFEMTDTRGVLFTFEQSSRRAVLLVFGNTACPVCLDKIPLLNRLSRQAEENALDVVFIAVGASRKDALSFVAQQNVHFRVLPDTTGRIARLYGVRYVPEPFLIDASGILVYDGLEKDSIWQLLD